ncbi:urease accessory protein UreF [Vibrio rumoiensis]|uniref:Urease accessory protein UreF n=1 Tax=Vibrio rumoiensis 1S-45 TaxID=1188252 RepID=A0A1E5E180_9VIBR|nr:urease accessory protein UreF [Vibrio rumoiensis]OEF24283.1 urease accessory protein UreF [Vibrio rumoiensis 1S-45]
MTSALKDNSPVNTEHRVGNTDVASFRLFQLISPSLPIGGFTYSQGLEWAVEAGWVDSQPKMMDWLEMMLANSLVTLELPILAKLYHAVHQDDFTQIEYWCDYLYSCRETSELRAEELQRGKALFTLLKQLDIPIDARWQPQDNSHAATQNQLLGFCAAAKAWSIPLLNLQQGYVWSWAENMVMAGVKLVPLGQTAGQKSLIELSDWLPKAIEKANQISDDDIGSFTPAVAIASSRHETQYTRLFRS